jgi:hypothetical protein
MTARQSMGTGGAVSPPSNSSRPLVVTWCTASKRRPASLGVATLASGTTRAVADAWLGQLRSTATDGLAREIYGGRAFRLAAEAAELLDADLRVVSAGLGWVNADAAIPAYDLTVSRGTLGLSLEEPFDAAGWWERILTGPFSTSPRDDVRSRPRMLVCLSRAYAPFILPAIADVDAERIRIFGAGLHDLVPDQLRASVMPYDDRVAGVGMTGTRSDFAQRALMHYARTIGTRGTLRHDRERILSLLEHIAPPAPWPRRRSLDDAAIRALIKSMLRDVGSRRTTLLRHLRDAKGVACEQGRFARLFAEVSEHA